MIALLILLPLYMGFMSRLAGNGWGSSFGFSTLPEILFTLPTALAPTYVAYQFIEWWSVAVFLVAGVISFVGMQAGTWMFLRWEAHDDPNTERSSTLKPIMDWIADKFGYKIGDEGYAWIAAGVKGFIISLPVGGVLGAILWPLGYEIGSHAHGRSHKIGIDDPHVIAEFMAGFLMAFAVLSFLGIAKLLGAI